MSDPARDDAYGTLFDHLPIGAYRSRPDGSLVRANLALATLNGFGRLQDLYPAVHDIGREWYVDASRRTLFRQLLERDGQVSGFVSEVRRYADGQRIWVNENAHLRRCPAGRVAYYEGKVEDISARIRSLAAMASTELTMREVAEHIPGMVYRVHMPYATNWPAFYSFVSSGVRALYGVDPETVLLDATALRRHRHPDDMARVDDAVAVAVRGNTPLNVAFRIVAGDTVKWVQMSSSTVAMDPHEQVRVGVVIDITAQRQAEALAAERAQVESERQQMMQFLSRVSHELRTPLNAILGLGQLIEMESDTPSLQRRWSRALLESGRHLLDLVDDVLDLTGAQSGQMAVQAADVDLAQVLREAWAMVRPDADARGLQFGGVPLAAGDGIVRADRRRLLQVLANLLSNAVKYNRQGGEVELQVRHAPGALELDVVDTGPGMTSDQMARLFSPFDRLGAQHGTVPGTGLGLALSRQLVLAMGGTLSAASVPGEGCRFTLRLPAA